MPRFLLATLLLLSGLRPALAQRLVTQTATLAAGQGVLLDLKFAHTIRVRPGAGLKVEARVSINGDQQNDLYSLALEQDGGELRVVEKLDEARLRESHYEGDCAGGSRTNSGSSSGRGSYAHSGGRAGNVQATVSYHRDGYSYCARIDYDVTLPAGAALRLSTISGDLDLSGLNGPLTLKTVSGNLDLRDLGGPVVARSVSGNVQLRGVRGNSLEAASVSGNVDLAWPPAQAAELRLHTVSGEVYADPAVTFSNLKPKSYVGYELHGTYAGRGSGPLVKLESVSGDVFFRKEK